MNNKWTFSIIFFILIYISGGSITIDDQDPLPSEDVSVIDENLSHIGHPVNSEFITISVTNEHGEKFQGQLPNG